MAKIMVMSSLELMSSSKRLKSVSYIKLGLSGITLNCIFWTSWINYSSLTLPMKERAVSMLISTRDEPCIGALIIGVPMAFYAGATSKASSSLVFLFCLFAAKSSSLDGSVRRG